MTCRCSLPSITQPLLSPQSSTHIITCTSTMASPSSRRPMSPLSQSLRLAWRSTKWRRISQSESLMLRLSPPPPITRGDLSEPAHVSPTPSSGMTHSPRTSAVKAPLRRVAIYRCLAMSIKLPWPMRFSSRRRSSPSPRAMDWRAVTCCQSHLPRLSAASPVCVSALLSMGSQ